MKIKYTISLMLVLISFMLNTQAQTISNGTIELSVSGTRGGSIDSFKVMGTETVDTADLGREIQTSLFFFDPLASSITACNGSSSPTWFNPQEAGDYCGVPSPIYALGKQGNTIHVGVDARDYLGRDNQTSQVRIEGHHTLGPLSYLPYNEVVQLKYQIYADTSPVSFAHTVTDDLQNPTPVPFIPAIYFKHNVLSNLKGLKPNGVWEDISPVNSTLYQPKSYKYLAMAWFRPDNSWGVALYGRWTMQQNINYVAQKMTANNLSLLKLVDQSLGTLPAGQGVERIAHLVVGNPSYIKSLVTHMYQNTPY